MRSMRKLIAIICMSAFVISLCACGNSAVKPADTTADTSPAETVTEADTNMPDETAPPADVASWEWETDLLDCYGYSNQYGTYGLEFGYPSVFQKSGYDDSGEQTRNFWYSPNGEDANSSDYNIVICFQQGGYGPHLSDLAEGMVDGKLEEKTIDSITVYVGQLIDESAEPNGFNYMYYMTYDEDDYARIWMIVHDQEEDGQFRQKFEETLKFVKE